MDEALDFFANFKLFVGGGGEETLGCLASARGTLIGESIGDVNVREDGPDQRRLRCHPDDAATPRGARDRESRGGSTVASTDTTLARTVWPSANISSGSTPPATGTSVSCEEVQDR